MLPFLNRTISEPILISHMAVDPETMRVRIEQIWAESLVTLRTPVGVKWIVVNLTFTWMVWALPPELVNSLFNVQNGLLAIAILLLPMAGYIWKPVRLGWWDTPLISKVHYRVRGESGQWYGLYNDFMCPNERIFGQFYGDFLTRENRLTLHAGEAHSRASHDAIQTIDDIRTPQLT